MMVAIYVLLALWGSTLLCAALMLLRHRYLERQERRRSDRPVANQENNHVD